MATARAVAPGQSGWRGSCFERAAWPNCVVGDEASERILADERPDLYAGLPYPTASYDGSLPIA